MTRIVLTVNCPSEGLAGYMPQQIVKQIQTAILARPCFGYYDPECFTIHVEEEPKEEQLSDLHEGPL